MIYLIVDVPLGFFMST